MDIGPEQSLAKVADPPANHEVMIRLEGVGKTFPDGTVAVEDLNLDIRRGELVCFVGPSGCGKSTTLKMINRLIEPTAGRIWVDGKDITNEDPVQLRRGIGYVIQNVGLFPHQRIETNVMTVPLLYGESKATARERAHDLLNRVGLDPTEFARRFPHQLSGGQRQRVGVARALAANPPVLLMDEPFGAVDPVVRGKLQEEFLNLYQNLGKTVVMVTHDIEEAVRMGDRVAVFAEGGRLAQYDSPAEVLGEPHDDFVAEFVGSSRGIRRLAVTPIDLSALGDAADVPASQLGGTIHKDANLEEVLSLMMREDKALIGVTDGAQFLGVLTPDRVHAMLRTNIADNE